MTRVLLSGLSELIYSNKILILTSEGRQKAAHAEYEERESITITRCYMSCRASGRFVRSDGEADGLETTSNISASHLTVGVSR